MYVAYYEKIKTMSVKGQSLSYTRAEYIGRYMRVENDLQKRVISPNAFFFYPFPFFFFFSTFISSSRTYEAIC